MERKIGEKFTIDGKTYVVEKAKNHCRGCAFFIDSKCTTDFDKTGTCLTVCRHTRDSVIFKEVNQNMKEFDLEAAKAGKPICTRDGRKARILCFDLVDKEYPIVAAITGKNGTEELETFTAKGRYDTFSDDVDGPDLMMAGEKKQGWIALLKSHRSSNVAYTTNVHKTEQEAKDMAGKDFICTVFIEWED